MKVKVAMTVALALSIVSSSALAGRAAWHEWKNLTSGATVCAQTSPGKGWVIFSGPYTDLKCTTRGTPHK
jgi:hypothetical protein